MLKLIAKFLFCCLVSWALYRFAAAFDSRHAPIGLVFAAVLWGKLFAPDIVNFFSWLKRSGEAAALEKWHGKFYVFDGCQLRFYLIDEVIWVPCRDLQPLLRPAISERELRLLGGEHRRITGKNMPAVSAAGLLRLMNSRTAGRHARPQMIRFKRWLASEALPNLQRLPASALI